MKKDCSVLVCSCDKYNDTWDIFFKCLEQNWNCPYELYLNTESFDYKYSGNLSINVLKTGHKEWGKRLKTALKTIDTEYVIFLLDDFFLTEKVDVTKLNHCIDWMNNNPKISVFSFYRTKTNNIKSTKYPGFEKRPKKCEYKLNCQAAIWRRKKLISYIRNHENPWDWELLGSVRASRYKEEFYSIMESEKSPFVYNAIYGGGVHRGKWVKEVMIPLTQKYNIDVDFSIRGFNEENKQTMSSKKNKFYKRVQNRLKYEYKKFKSLI